MNNYVRRFRALRKRHGAGSAIGHRCSNVEEIMNNMPPDPEQSIEYLISDETRSRREHLMRGLKRQLAGLVRLGANQ